MEIILETKEFLQDNWMIVVLSVLALVLYHHFTNTFNFFRERGITFLKPTIFVGNIGKRIFMKLSFHELQIELYNRLDGLPYGGFFEGRRPVLMIRDPELIKTILIKDFDYFMDRNSLVSKQPPYIQRMLLSLKGQEWKGIRAVLTPTFSSARLRNMSIIVNDCAKQMVQYLKERKDDSEIEMKQFMGRFTLEVIGTCAFGIESSSLKDDHSNFMKVAQRFDYMSFPKRMLVFALLIFMPQAFKYVPLTFMNYEATKELRNILAETKAIRRKSPETRRNDFLQLLIDAADKEKEECEKEPIRKPAMDEDTVDAQALLFLIAGFETSSTLLAFASFVLAEHTEVQTRARREVREVWEKYGECSYDAVNDMEYLEMVLLETLRMYSPVSRVDRLCTRAYTLPGTNISIQPGQALAFPVAGLHNDPLFYPRPREFKPDRFSSEEKKNRPQSVYLPFGAGPRNCIGLRFAMISVKMALANLLRDFELNVCSKTCIPMEYNKRGFLLKAKDGIWLKVVPLQQ